MARSAGTIKKILAFGDNVLFSTLLIPDKKISQSNDWWYFVPETGQHVAFYSVKSLKILSELYKKGLLYESVSIQPYSPAAGTGLSSHELNQPGTYKDVKDTSAVAMFKAVRNKKSEFLFQKSEIGNQKSDIRHQTVDIFFLADLRPFLQRFGNRGYRAVQLEAGILGGKIYLGAYAQHLGATGLTFYDDEVIKFFSPHAEGKSAIFLVAVGNSAKPKPING